MKKVLLGSLILLLCIAMFMPVMASDYEWTDEEVAEYLELREKRLQQEALATTKKQDETISLSEEFVVGIIVAAITSGFSALYLSKKKKSSKNKIDQHSDSGATSTQATDQTGATETKNSLSNASETAHQHGSYNVYGSDIGLTPNEIVPKDSKKPISDNKFEEIRQYKYLLDEGIISEEDFKTKKKELLGL